MNNIQNLIKGIRTDQNIHIIKYLCNFTPGVKENIQNIFIIACENGDINIVKYLYQTYNLNTSNITKYNFYTINIACEYGYTHILQYLLNILHNNNVKNIDITYGTTKACENGHYDIIKYIISTNKQYKNIIYNPNICMLSACINSHIDIIGYLYDNKIPLPKLGHHRKIILQNIKYDDDIHMLLLMKINNYIV